MHSIDADGQREDGQAMRQRRGGQAGTPVPSPATTPSISVNTSTGRPACVTNIASHAWHRLNSAPDTMAARSAVMRAISRC